MELWRGLFYLDEEDGKGNRSQDHEAISGDRSWEHVQQNIKFNTSIIKIT